MVKLIRLSLFFCLVFHVNCSSNFSFFSTDERLALLQFKFSFSIYNGASYKCLNAAFPKTNTWEEGTDCCSWDGVTCDGLTGRVIGLDLSCSMLNGSIPSNSSLFHLSHLQTLNLAHNDFAYSQMPPEFGFLVKLTHLNLSMSNFFGKIPPEISHLSKLVSLDLSCDIDVFLQLDNHAFDKHTHNLTELRVLNLNGVEMSLVAVKSLLNLSSSLKSLRLGDCSMMGELPDDFSRFSLLEELDLSNNYEITGDPKFNQSSPIKSLNFSGTQLFRHFPESLCIFKSLEYLDLSSCSLTGPIPASLSNLEQLKFLDLSCNHFAGLGQIPDAFFNLSKLETFYLTNNHFTGPIPASLSNLEHLKFLDLSSNHFVGQIPDAFSNLSKLETFYLTYNHFTGPIPASLGNLTSLESLSLGYNNISGSLLFSVFNLTRISFLDFKSNQVEGPLPHNVRGLLNLAELDLSGNKLNGSIPSWLFTLPSLKVVNLRGNKFAGPIHPFQRPNSLGYVDLSNDEMHPPIQNSVSELLSLEILDLSSNNLSGIIDWIMLQKFKNLSELYLSQNSELSLRASIDVNFTLQWLRRIDMSSCNITEFPHFLGTLEHLEYLDLSKNRIHGKISKQGSEGWGNLKFLDLSHNNLTELEMHPWDIIVHLNLSSNQIQGPLSVPPSTTEIFKISKNNLSGELPSSICNLSFPGVLDLSDNQLGGVLPQCLGNGSFLTFLDLRNNSFHGSLPDAFTNASGLMYLNLNGNQFEGRMPRSLANCGSLEVLDLGNNKINDTFPHWLENHPQLKVLILRSNNLHGVITQPATSFPFQKLQILDLSHNQFTGILPNTLLEKLKYLMKGEENHDRTPQYVGDDRFYDTGEVIVRVKQTDIVMRKILTIFKSIDFSDNQFQGEIPEAVGKFESLKSLNFSHNSLAGHIPSSLGNLMALESLDLSSNKLVGQIPQQLAALLFLEVLNLSYNQLIGPIPEGKQLSTFLNDSYVGNLGLCGFPLSKKCHSEPPQVPPAMLHDEDDSTSWFDWKIVMMGYGCGVGFGLSMGYIVFTTGKPWWFVRMVEKKQDIIMTRINRRRGGRKKSAYPRGPR